MISIHRLTLELRKRLKKPLGILLRGSLEEITAILRTLIEKEKPEKFITVGDRVSEDFTNSSLTPSILIVDNKVMRKKIPPISATADQIINVKNPPGTITNEAWFAIEKAMKS